MTQLVDATREVLREQLREAARDVPDWGLTPSPNRWLDALEAFIDAKILEAMSGNE